MIVNIKIFSFLKDKFIDDDIFLPVYLLEKMINLYFHGIYIVEKKNATH